MARPADVGSQAAAPETAPPSGDPSLGVPSRLDPLYCVAKRLMDVVGASAGIVLCLPIWAVAAILIKIESPGPVFFVQDRVGEHGRRFRFLKLRTMYVDAEQRRAALGAQNEMDGPVFKMRHDPRITRTGRFLRRFSLDETPQLLHVLVGQMSLVGPRPPLVDEVARYEPWMTERLSVRPGLTCIWLVSGRNEVPFERWVQMDIDYVRHRTLAMDFRLLLQTFPAVISGRGAY
jgi:lipopolysaccharide/colanic/teichoic acid biosynthesis glycosyltransferase